MKSRGWCGRVSAVILGVALSAALTASSSAGVVAPGPQVTTVTLTSSAYPEASSELTLNFDHPVNEDQAQILMRPLAVAKEMRLRGSVLEGETDAVQAVGPLSTDPQEISVVTAAAGPSGAYLQCNRTYVWSDGNGAFSLQRRCGGTTAPWGWHISGALQPYVVGSLNESGMTWTNNGVVKPQMAPHSVPPSYTIHGTFNPARAGNRITYSDYIRFRHSIGSGGNATIHIYGSFTLTNNPPCGSSSPC